MMPTLSMLTNGGIDSDETRGSGAPQRLRRRRTTPSTNMARLAYGWREGDPLGFLIWSDWNGQKLILGTPVNVPKMKVLPTTRKLH